MVYFIEKAQFQQDPSDEYWTTQMKPEDELVNLFLDRLAILIARFNKNTKRDAEKCNGNRLDHLRNS